MILLDTNAFLWLAFGQPLRSPGLDLIIANVAGRQLGVSAVTAWELGNLARAGRVRLEAPPGKWFSRALDRIHASPIGLSVDAALKAGELPAWDHRDPADRLLVATALTLGVPIVTRDHRILAYAEAGHVQAAAC